MTNAMYDLVYLITTAVDIVFKLSIITAIALCIKRYNRLYPKK